MIPVYSDIVQQLICMRLYFFFFAYEILKPFHYKDPVLKTLPLHAHAESVSLQAYAGSVISFSFTLCARSVFKKLKGGHP